MSSPRKHQRITRSSPATPVIRNGITLSTESPKRSGLSHLRSRLVQRLEISTGHDSSTDGVFRADSKTSPMLTKLRNTPAGLLKEKQQLLMKKHESARQRSDSLNVGGGVSMWPQMEKMRLTGREVMWLGVSCIGLFLLVMVLFYKLHGSVLSLLMKYHKELSMFHKNHRVVLTSDQEEFESSLLRWHSDYRDLVDRIFHSFDVKRLPVPYIVYISIYSFGVLVLLYYLIDNMFAKSKLSPRRIKKWVCILTVISTWTVLMAYLLSTAYTVELAINRNVHQLGEVLADLVSTNINCDKFHSVLSYWRIRCLPPTTLGTISILGVVSIRDVIHYLQYYSLPVLTVIITPVFNLIVSLMTVYNIKHR